MILTRLTSIGYQVLLSRVMFRDNQDLIKNSLSENRIMLYLNIYQVLPQVTERIRSGYKRQVILN